MKTYGAITEVINNDTPTNHMKKVAKNNVFVFGEDITAPHFFDYGEDKTAAQKNVFALREDKTVPQSFFAHTAKTKKRTPIFFCLRRI